MLKALLRKLHIQHDWHVEHTEDGALYKRCKRCGKDDYRSGLVNGQLFLPTGGPGVWRYS
jgi:hypothetical protein